jgi:hypothetical protein
MRLRFWHHAPMELIFIVDLMSLKLPSLGTLLLMYVMLYPELDRSHLNRWALHKTQFKQLISIIGPGKLV